jgi:hypothetical protein
MFSAKKHPNIFFIPWNNVSVMSQLGVHPNPDWDT